MGIYEKTYGKKGVFFLSKFGIFTKYEKVKTRRKIPKGGEINSCEKKNLQAINKKKLIDIGFRYSSSTELEIRFWTVSSRNAGVGYRMFEGLILVNQLETKIDLLYRQSRAVVLCFAAMVFTIREVYFLMAIIYH